MFDALSIIFWSVAYVLAIIAGFKSWKTRLVSIPFAAALQNVAWEFVALVTSRGFWGHIAWFSLDVLIVIFSVIYLDRKWKKAVYLSLLPVFVVIFFIAFQIPNGMLLSSFVIDILMAFYFLARRKMLSSVFKVPIAVVKLLGDLSAAIYYGPDLVPVAVISVIVFVCNSVYLYLCIKEKTTTFDTVS